MANSVGIIDQSYRGNIYVALTKICPEAKPIQFPFRCCQLIIRPQYQTVFEESNVEFTEHIVEMGDLEVLDYPLYL